jgi:Ras-related protein Rab-11A
MSYKTDENNLSTYSNKNSLLDDSKYSQKKKEESILRTTYKFKVILLGESSVGKTSILHRFIGQKFAESYRCTVGVEFKIKSILLDPYTSAELKIWDTCGEEKFQSVTRQYYNDTNGIILLYDLSDKNTFNSLNKWLKEIRNYAPKNTVIIIVGNKVDLERKVSHDDAITFANNENISYLEVSAKNGINIELIFEKLCKEMVIKKKEIIEENNESENIKLGNKSVDYSDKLKEFEKKGKEVPCC